MKTLLVILQLLPALIDALRAIESIWPEAGKGAEKLAMLKELMEKIYPAINDVWPAIENTIAILVALFNKNGIFKKG